MFSPCCHDVPFSWRSFLLSLKLPGRERSVALHWKFAYYWNLQKCNFVQLAFCYLCQVMEVPVSERIDLAVFDPDVKSSVHYRVKVSKCHTSAFIHLISSSFIRKEGINMLQQIRYRGTGSIPRLSSCNHSKQIIATFDKHLCGSMLWARPI